jgi:hypothetical protein
MKFLFENLIEDATLSSLNESLNYPPDNLDHIFLEKRYQPLASLTDTITGEWDEDVTISEWFVGFHTLSSYTLRLYDYDAIELYSFSVSSPNDIDFVEFDAVEDVRYFEMDVVFSASPAYIGGLGSGVCLELTDFETNYSLPIDDTSDFEESAYGQTLQSPRGTLDEFDFEFNDKTLAVKSAFITAYKALRKGKPIYVAFFNEDTRDIAPLYAKFTRAPETEKNHRRFDIRIRIKEAR